MMIDLTAHHLRFNLLVETAIELDEHQGGALRGMLFNALRGPKNKPALGFCTQRHLTTCVDCALVTVCPVASLVSTLKPRAERGRDAPRPYAIVPPTGGQTHYQPGASLSFGLTLFGNALKLFPYVVMGLRQAGQGGLGKRLPRPENKGRYQRGRFKVQSVQALHLLTGEVQDILAADTTLVQQPHMPVTQTDIEETSQQLLSQAISSSTNGHNGRELWQRGHIDEVLTVTVHFITPTRLIFQRQLLKTPHFSPFFQRLLERLQTLAQVFGEPVQATSSRPAGSGDPEPASIPLDKNRLLALSDQVELVKNQTHWQEVWSYSARQQKKTPISGLRGQATYQADRRLWAVLLPYLLWGTIIHVGKNAVKGDGMIAVTI